MDFPFKQERAKLTSYVMSPAVKGRLDALQVRLVDAGCVDLHFTWNREALASGTLSLDDVVNGACAILEAFLNGEMTVMEAFDDDAGVLNDIEPASGVDPAMTALIEGVKLH